MKRLMVRVAAVLVGLSWFCSGANAIDLSDSQTKEEMARRSSLLCPGYTTERGVPGIQAVKVDSIRVLLSHQYTLCPDRRIGGDIGAIWNSRWGVLLWNPLDPKSIATMAKQADALAHTLDFPNELTVYGFDGKPLTGRTVPQFEPRDTFVGF